jgi:hypothetical protein
MLELSAAQRQLLAVGLAATVAFAFLPQGSSVSNGEELFDRAFRFADGLGTPEMNADSCRGCHQDPIMGGAGGLEVNVSRFGRDDGGFGVFTNLPGGQSLSKLHPPQTPGREEHPISMLPLTVRRRATPKMPSLLASVGSSLAVIS